MSKLFKLTTLSILSLIAIFGLFNNVSTEASTQYTVNAKSGLNFRNQNCKIIKTLRYGTKVNGTSGSITCKVNGINYKMINTADGYAAVDVAGGGCEHRPIRPPRRRRSR